MIQIEKKWYPEQGDYKAWLSRTRQEVSTHYNILKEKTGLTYTGGEWVIFYVGNK